MQAPVKATQCILDFPPGWFWHPFFTIHWPVTGRRGTLFIDTVFLAEQAQDYSVYDYVYLPVTVDTNIDIFCAAATFQLDHYSLYRELKQVKRRGGWSLFSWDGTRQAIKTLYSPLTVQLVLNTGSCAPINFRHDCKTSMSRQEIKHDNNKPCHILVTKSNKVQHHVKWLLSDLWLTNLNDKKVQKKDFFHFIFMILL